MADLNKSIGLWQGTGMMLNIVLGAGLLTLPGLALMVAGDAALTIWIACALAAAPLLGGSLTATGAQAQLAAVGSETIADSYSVNRNWSKSRVWGKLKSKLRDRAKRHCVSNYSSYGSNILRQVRFNKGTYTNSRANTRIDGSISFLCK